MSGIDIISDKTGKEIASALTTIARNSMPTNVSFDYLENLVDNGSFEKLFTIGDQIQHEWTDDNQQYTVDVDYVHSSDVELADGTVLHKRPHFMWHWTEPSGIQFSNYRAFYYCENELPAGTYNITFAQAWGKLTADKLVWSFTLTRNVPAGGAISGFRNHPDITDWSNVKVYTHSADRKSVVEEVVAFQGASGQSLGTLNYTTRNGNLNSMQEIAYGYNNYEKSAVRQYLNSDAPKNQWWVKQDNWDIAPEELKTKNGFLYGIPSEIKERMKKVKIKTWTNTVCDGGQEDYSIVYDKVFLPCLENMNINPQKAGEGEVWDYFKRLKGTSGYFLYHPNIYTELKSYAINNKAQAQSLRLRSAARGVAYGAWGVYAGGYVSSSDARASIRLRPCFVL